MEGGRIKTIQKKPKKEEKLRHRKSGTNKKLKHKTINIKTLQKLH